MSPNHHNPVTIGPLVHDMFMHLQEAKPAMHERNFRWRNQRQLRKNKRRRLAAGFKS